MDINEERIPRLIAFEEDGLVRYYEPIAIYRVGDQLYAVLVPADEDENEEIDDLLIARVGLGVDGVEVHPVEDADEWERAVQGLAKVAPQIFPQLEELETEDGRVIDVMPYRPN